MLRRLQVQVDERRQPRTSTTVKELVTRHLELARLEETTARRYRSCVNSHILPLLGSTKVGAVDADVLNSFCAELQRCRLPLGPPTIHRTPNRPAPRIDTRCHPDQCKPRSASSVRQLHFILSGAFKWAVRSQWVATNPIRPVSRRPQRPPRIVEDAFSDLGWARWCWLAMTSGARRGELCALQCRKLILRSAWSSSTPALVNVVLHLVPRVRQERLVEEHEMTDTEPTPPIAVAIVTSHGRVPMDAVAGGAARRDAG